MSIGIKPDNRPIMPDYLLPENFNRTEISHGIKNAGAIEKKKSKNRLKRKRAKKQARQNRK